ncbi:MAG: hypothetical protein DWH91_00370 [Planctomycetota bacterium]|nr:MAG: hypothetical protein DWH91_00370 [Planctomycetota bacterium]
MIEVLAVAAELCPALLLLCNPDAQSSVRATQIKERLGHPGLVFNRATPPTHSMNGDTIRTSMLNFGNFRLSDKAFISKQDLQMVSMVCQRTNPGIRNALSIHG